MTVTDGSVGDFDVRSGEVAINPPRDGRPGEWAGRVVCTLGGRDINRVSMEAVEIDLKVEVGWITGRGYITGIEFNRNRPDDDMWIVDFTGTGEPKKYLTEAGPREAELSKWAPSLAERVEALEKRLAELEERASGPKPGEFLNTPGLRPAAPLRRDAISTTRLPEPKPKGAQ